MSCLKKKIIISFPLKGNFTYRRKVRYKNGLKSKVTEVLTDAQISHANWITCLNRKHGIEFAQVQGFGARKLN